MVTTQCSDCGKHFNRNEKSTTSMDGALGRSESNPLCYDCALKNLIGDYPPEISDFYTALIISGEMDDRTWEYMQEDLRSVEDGRSPNYDRIDRRYDNDYVDPAWCYDCNRDTAFCLCICYKCYEKFEDCECICPVCDTPQSDGLCDKCDSEWDEAKQGQKPEWSNEVKTCSTCGVKFYHESHYWDKDEDDSPSDHKCPNCR